MTVTLRPKIYLRWFQGIDEYWHIVISFIDITDARFTPWYAKRYLVVFGKHLGALCQKYDLFQWNWTQFQGDVSSLHDRALLSLMFWVLHGDKWQMMRQIWNNLFWSIRVFYVRAFLVFLVLCLLFLCLPFRNSLFTCLTRNS